MLTLNANFKEALLRVPNEPSFIAKMVQSEIYAQVDSQTDWQAGKQLVGLDLTTEPGSALLPKTTPTGITQTSQNVTCQFSFVNLVYPPGGQATSPTTPGTTSFAWQSFKQTSGQYRLINKVKVHLLATGSKSTNAEFYNYFKVQLFDSKNGTAISTVKQAGGPAYTVDGLVEFDFSAENISLTSGTTYWIKIYGWSIVTVYSAGSSASCSSFIRYHNVTTTYADGQADVKPYNSTESINAGDIAFTISFLPTYANRGYGGYLMDLGATPTVPGEVRIDRYTPDTSIAPTRLYSMPDIAGLTQSTMTDVVVYTNIGSDGRRLFRLKSTSPYMQYSDNRGSSWSDITGSGLTAPGKIVINSGKVLLCTNDGTNTNTVWISADSGMNWTAKTLSASGYWRPFFVNGKFYLLNYGANTTAYQYSSDDTGATWNAGTFSNSNYWNSISHNGTTYVVTPSGILGTTSTYMTSTNGTSWSAATFPVTWAFGYSGFISGPNLFWCTVESGGSTYYTSSTGATGSWTSRSFPSTINNAAIKSNGITILAHGSDGGTINSCYGTDLINWTSLGTNLAGMSPLGWIPLDCGFYSTPGGTGTAKLWFPSGTTYYDDVDDMDTITSLHRYHFAGISLIPSTNNSWGPYYRAITVYFPTWVTISTTNEKGYEPSLNTVSSLQTSIDTFKESTVGQITLNIGLTKMISTWLKTAYPRNKEVRIFAGFTSIAEADYISYYRGCVENWSISKDLKVTVSLRDFNKSWKDKPVPKSWQSATDNKTWTAQHPIDVMLNILQGYIEAQSRSINTESFASARSVRNDWTVTNTLTGKTYDAKELLEQLRFIIGAYFIPGNDGRIKLKLWNPNEASVRSLSDDDFNGLEYEGNSDSLINLLYWYYNINDDGTGKSGGIGLYVAEDGTSQFNWGEKKVFEFKDIWTLTAQNTQVFQIAGDVILRYAAAPDVFKSKLALRHIDLEVGDMVDITTKKAPSTDLTGISNVKYQIVRKDLDFANKSIKIEVLRAAA